MNPLSNTSSYTIKTLLQPDHGLAATNPTTVVPPSAYQQDQELLLALAWRNQRCLHT
jgi:hypothetical protein